MPGLSSWRPEPCSLVMPALPQTLCIIHAQSSAASEQGTAALFKPAVASDAGPGCSEPDAAARAHPAHREPYALGHQFVSSWAYGML